MAFGIVNRPNTQEKLEILGQDAQYDLSCACSSRPEESRHRGEGGKWIYPVSLPHGGTSVLFKTLLSNVCSNDCRYCPLREDQDLRRCTLTPEETVQTFLQYYQQGRVFGLFLSSGVMGTPDATMQRLNAVVEQLRRKHHFKGYIHLKVIPGASDAAVEQAVALASAVSLNVETPGAENMARLSQKKDYMRDIVAPIKLISRLTQKGGPYSRVKQTTQFIVGAAGEADQEIVRYMARLYDRVHMSRIYFSAYQKGLGDQAMVGEQQHVTPEQVFQREHRLYQVDFLFRQYGFSPSDIEYDAQGQLSLSVDPKERWALRHPEMFPVNVNTASRWSLLRVPGLGPLTVKRILKARRIRKFSGIEDIGKVGVRLARAANYLTF
ncbi:MAG: radical SAM protein [Phycisphaerae bacterium]|nr:radical SAM protein [Phycisphaerae bacterium]